MTDVGVEVIAAPIVVCAAVACDVPTYATAVVYELRPVPVKVTTCAEPGVIAVVLEVDVTVGPTPLGPPIPRPAVNTLLVPLGSCT